MRKTFVLFITLLGISLLGFSQGLPSVGRKAGQAVLKKPGRGGGSVAVKAPKAPRVPVTGAAARNAAQTGLSSRGAARAAARMQAVRAADQAPKITPKRLDLEKQYQAALAKRQELELQKWQQSFHTGIGKSVLFAPDGWDPDIGYSVTVFKTSYNGQEEIFGIIPSHSLPLADHFHDFTVGLEGMEFPIHIMHSTGEEMVTKATVIQATSPSMLDITLVKLDPAALPYVEPLTLSPSNALLHERLFSYGYAAGTSTGIDRSVNAQSFLSVRTNQAIEGDRYGFCGSPLLDVNGQIKAIHTGSVVGVAGKEDVSYGTHVAFIRKLVEAYHNGGQATYELVLGKHKLAKLNVDEYIADVTLYDKQGNALFTHAFEDKFSQSVVLKALKEHPKARYVGLTSRTAQLIHTDRQGTVLDEHRSSPQETRQEHWYNLQTQQIEPSRPAIIKQ